jgi:hypothetical protein
VPPVPQVPARSVTASAPMARARSFIRTTAVMESVVAVEPVTGA